LRSRCVDAHAHPGGRAAAAQYTFHGYGGHAHHQDPGDTRHQRVPTTTRNSPHSAHSHARSVRFGSTAAPTAHSVPALRGGHLDAAAALHGMVRTTSADRRASEPHRTGRGELHVVPTH